MPSRTEYNRKWLAKNRERKRATNKAWIARNREYHLDLKRYYNLEWKVAAFEAYGGPRCVCCGEDRLPFLTLDHANDDGHVDKKTFKTNTQFYVWLKRNCYPKEKNLRVMCFNCNCGRRVNGGECPHHGLHPRFHPNNKPKIEDYRK